MPRKVLIEEREPQSLSFLDPDLSEGLRFANSGCQKKSSISSLNQSPLLMAGVRSLESLERPRIERTYHPIDRMGVETNRTRHSQTKTNPSAMGHAHTDAHANVTRKRILEASLGVSVPLWFLLGDSR